MSAAPSGLGCGPRPRADAPAGRWPNPLAPRQARRAAAPGPPPPACAAAATPPAGAPAPRASAIPPPDEDREVMHAAFMSAFTEAQPEECRVPGLQEFAAAVLARARIPSQAYADPLHHVFGEFDADRDGFLTPREVAAALASRGVEASPAQVQMFMDSVELADAGKVAASEFRDLVLHMAAADLHSRRALAAEDGGEWIRCTLESDDEIQEKLASWTASLMARRYK
jgi:hypothetical protein